MSNRIPEKIDCKLFARNGVRLAGDYPGESFTRLGDLVQNAGELVAFEVEFSIAPDGYVTIQGHVHAKLQLICQRCLNPYHYVVEATFLLAVIENERLAENLPEQYEPYVASDVEDLQMLEIIEDELILSIPIIPKHDGGCIAEFPVTPVVETAEKRKNPFAVLAALKNK